MDTPTTGGGLVRDVVGYGRPAGAAQSAVPAFDSEHTFER